MKNNIKNFIYILIFVSMLISSQSKSDEIKFEANSIELIDKDERILAKKNVKIFNEEETIYADEMDYDKVKQIIKAKGNIIVENYSAKNDTRLCNIHEGCISTSVIDAASQSLINSSNWINI